MPNSALLLLAQATLLHLIPDDGLLLPAAQSHSHASPKTLVRGELTIPELFVGAAVNIEVDF